MTLDRIGLKHGTDKASNHHNYMPVYERYFEHLRHEPIVLLELGFGGYQYPDRGGAGAKTWAEYFEKGVIATTDIHPKNSLNHDRIFFFQGSQADGAFLLDVIGKTDRPNIIIDDGSHRVVDVLESFEILFPVLRSGGIYVIEDIESSYSDLHGYGGDPNPFTGVTSMSFFKDLADQLNHQYFAAHYKNEYAGLLDSIHFHRNLVIIIKK
jgi:hypothetical protein